MSAAPRLSELQVGWSGAETRVFAVHQVMRDALTEQDRQVWLHLRDAGGWWRWAEICHELRIDKARGPSSMARLFNRCHLSRRRVRRESGGANWAYGVTNACRPLPGHTLVPRVTVEALS